MQLIPGFSGEARKFGGEGLIRYLLWVDDSGNLYVQFSDNIVDTPSPGKFSGLLYSVAHYAPIRQSEVKIPHPHGYDLEIKTWVTKKDNNNGAFLKAVLRHLLPQP